MMEAILLAKNRLHILVFPGGPVVKAPMFLVRRPGFDSSHRGVNALLVSTLDKMGGSHQEGHPVYKPVCG